MVWIGLAMTWIRLLGLRVGVSKAKIMGKGGEVRLIFFYRELDIKSKL